MQEGSVSSHGLDFQEFTCGEDVATPEDLAWADSCLAINDPDLSKTDWNSMRNALLEVFNSDPDPLSSSAAGTQYFPKETDDYSVLNSRDGLETAQFSERTDDDSVPIHSRDGPETAQFSERTDDDSVPMHKEVIDGKEILDDEEGASSTSYVKGYMVNPFLPNYNDEISVSGGTDLGEDFLSYEMEARSEDIFKVWDLAIPAEEEELLEEFYKVSSENDALSSPHYASWPWKRPVVDVPLDDMIAALADLSLS